MVQAMKTRLCQVVLLLASGILPSTLLAQDAASHAALAADREAAEERYQRLSNDVQDLVAAQAVLQKRISALADTIRDLRDEQIKATTQAVSRDELRRLALKVQEIDQKREDDKKIILEELQKLLKLPSPAPAPAIPPPALTPSSRVGSGVERGYEHVVEPGQYLSTIIQAYRDQGVKVTQKQVLDANPGLNPNKLRTGQKIFIPDASK
jgi:TolA-binding protein